jgi:2-polyprenyl-3-methyl-5-hydroxy-6-metoxy-1,4-benzoquinol methylase
VLISEAYRAANARLHDALPYYGSYGGRHAEQVRALMSRRDCKTLLDYGAGKGGLALAMPDVPVTNYDPVTYPDEPEPADFVACLDVLEHIEPECFKAVLWHLRSKVLKAGFLTIATRPAKKVLADGRNAHLIVRPPEWWLPKFQKRFSLVEVLPISSDSELSIYVEA